MKYITSCPACETQFLLTKEHLKAYKGKVQCGNCEHIFNAKNRLTEISDTIQSTAEYNASLGNQGRDSSTGSASIEATGPAHEKPSDAAIDTVLSSVLESVPSLQNLESESATLSSQQSELSDTEPTIYLEDLTANNLQENIGAYDADSINAPIEIEDLTTNPNFDKPKIKTNGWLVLLSLLFAMLAGLQTVYANRTQIAAEYPQFKPLLVQSCAALQCEIALPKTVDLLTIDDSDMQEDEDHENVIKFSSLLINNANYVQAYPDIELTLTATDDEPVLRRLIKPNEYLQANVDAASGIGAREEVRLHLAINVKDLAVAGYRVLLVY